MAENNNTNTHASKSRLKRKKCSVEELQAEVFSGGTSKENSKTVLSCKSSAGSAAPGVPWWSRDQLSDVESLWAVMLKSALPYLEDQHWEPVPDLPLPSTTRPAALKLDEQWCCDLSGEVPPFPEPSPPSLMTLSSLDPLRLSSPQQDLSALTKPALEPTVGQLFNSSHSPKHSTTSPQLNRKKQRISHSGWKEAAASGGPSGSGVTGQQLAHCGQEKEGETKKEKKEEQGTTTEDGGDGGGEMLKSCPMCLQVFPSG
ncbi:uncharacterized protein KZ484_015120 [Pholidichthys leucotaenia]